MKVRSWGRKPGRPRTLLAYMHRTLAQLVSRGQETNINGAALSLVGQKKVRILPAALFTGHRPFWVVLTVTEVRHEVVKPDNSTAAKYSVVAGNLQL